MFLLLAVIYCVVCWTSGQTKYCCAPSQWEGVIFITSGSTVNGGPGIFTQGTEILSVDSKAQMIAVDGFINTGGIPNKFKVIQDFKKSAQYTIKNGTCTKDSLGPWESQCVPDTATLLDSSYYGSGDVAMPVDIYMFQMGSYTVYLNVAKDSCIPFLEATYGSRAGEETVIIDQFANVTTGIKDPSVFTIPDICKHASFAPSTRPRHSPLF